MLVPPPSPPSDDTNLFESSYSRMGYIISRVDGSIHDEIKKLDKHLGHNHLCRLTYHNSLFELVRSIESELISELHAEDHFITGGQYIPPHGIISRCGLILL